MKRPLRLVALLLITPFILPLNAQLPYGNEWIDFSNTNPYFRADITATGIYRIDYNTLSNALQQAGVSISSIDPRHTQVFHDGKQLHIHVEGESDGQFHNTDFIEFFAEKNDGAFDTRLYENPEQQPNPYYSIINDTAAYFITWNSAAASPKLRLAETPNNLSNPPPVENYFIHKTFREYHNQLSQGKSYFTDGVYLYNSQFEEGEGYVNTSFNKTTVTRQMTIDKIYSGGPATNAVMVSRVFSMFNQVHRLKISVNNTPFIDSTFGTVWDGERVNTYMANIPLSTFNNGAQADDIQFQALGTGSSDRHSIGFIEMYYPRTFDFGNAATFDFTLSGSLATNKYLEISNFDHQNNPPILHDMGNHQRMLGIINSGIVKYNIPFAQNDTAKIYLSSATEIKQISSLKKVGFIDFGSQANQGDYIIVTNKLLLDDGTGNNWVEAYRAYRSSIAGGSFNAIAVTVDQLFNQFSYGINNHPLGIQNFIRFAKDQFQVKPGHLFIIGKGLEYGTTRNPAYYKQCLVPTFGHPGSDNMLAANEFTIVPQLAVGRLAARNGNQVKTYYDKIRDQESNQNNTNPLEQTIAEKAWTKQVMHFGGGSTASEQSLFKQFLYNYEQTIRDTFFGGDVKSFFKSNPDPIQYIQSQYIDSLINNGISLITFFGHSSTNSFDISIDKPENYNNKGKYPVIISNGCFSGGIHNLGRGISEDFILEPDKGAIGFIASVSFGEVWSLNTFSSTFYQFLSKQHYGQSVGTVMHHVLAHIGDTLSPSLYLKLLLEQQTLHGDPAIQIANYKTPDYVMESSNIHFDPPQVSVDLDSFDVLAIVYNIGKALDTVYDVQVKRYFQDGTMNLATKRVKASKFIDTVRFTFFTDPVNGINQNTFEVTVDAANEIQEVTKINNIASTTMSIRSDDAFPVYPYEFSIISTGAVDLKASTANPFAPAANYIMQADTTMEFNSPLLQTKNITQSGGVVEWNNVPLQWIDSTVYYWRISPDYGIPDSFKWHASSFTYIPASLPGWNQSHYFQYEADKMANLLLTANRKFKFVDDVKDIQASNGIYSHISWEKVSAYHINNELINRWSCVGNGLVISVFDSISAIPWRIEDFNFGEVECSGSQRGAFHFPTNTTAQRQKAMKFIDTIPVGNHFLMFSFQYPKYGQWRSDSVTLGTHLFDKILGLGGADLYRLDTLGYTVPFILIGKKGYPQLSSTLVGKATNSFIDTTYHIVGAWDRGYLSSTLIGPASSWHSLHWGYRGIDTIPTDVADLTITGVDIDGNRTPLASGLTISDTALAFIDAGQHHFLELKVDVKDETFRTAPQFTHLRVLYDEVPEIAVNPLKYFMVSKDTLHQGEILDVALAIENIGQVTMDSVLVSYALIDRNNMTTKYLKPVYGPLAAGDTLIVRLTLETIALTGSNTIVVEANPDNFRLEQYHFNNYAFIPFFVKKDNFNPLLDVTFDGVHIMNGDIVSAKPEILISLKDENKYLGLTDTSLIDVYIRYPEGFKEKIPNNSPILSFFPADTAQLSKDNTATIRLNPEFETDGIYELIVAGRDVTGNESGNLDYTVSFEVINKSMISNVLNYPNPFTSSTRFVFTLTGAEIPTYMKIQVMTVSGKIVREITQTELGPIHIGTNITEYAWDGTDQYGDPLANGLYLYRVIALNNGEQIENYALGKRVDKYFQSGFGKMYLAR